MRRGRVLGLGLMLLAGCEGAQLQQGSNFELVRANGQPLPFVLRADNLCVHRLFGGGVDLDGKGGYRASYRIRRSCPDSSATLPNVGIAGKFRVRNDTAFFTDSAGHPAGHGFITPDSLIVQSLRHRLAYARRQR